MTPVAAYSLSEKAVLSPNHEGKQLKHENAVLNEMRKLPYEQALIK